MKKIYDLFDFDEIEIKTRKDSYDHVYTARLKKHMTFEMFDERDYLPTNEYRDWETDRKSTRLNSSHSAKSRMPSSA